MNTIRLIICALLLCWGRILHAEEETPREVIAGLLAQESCDCLEVTELSVEGGTHKKVLLFKKIEQDLQEIRMQIIGSGADHGYAYYSRIGTGVSVRDIMWVYRPQDGKVRRYNSILHGFLDTGIPPYFVDRAGWWWFYEWKFKDGEKGLYGAPLADYSFLPEVIIEWEKEGEIPHIISLRLVARGNVFLTATFFRHQRVGNKIRPGKIVIGPPDGPITTIIMRRVRFEKPDEEWASQIFHQERLPERRTPTGLQTHHGEIFAEIDFSP